MPSTVTSDTPSQVFNIKLIGGPLNGSQAIIVTVEAPQSITRLLNEDVVIENPDIIPIGPKKGELNGTIFSKAERYHYDKVTEEDGFILYAYSGKSEIS